MAAVLGAGLIEPASAALGPARPCPSSRRDPALCHRSPTVGRYSESARPPSRRPVPPSSDGSSRGPSPWRNPPRSRPHARPIPIDRPLSVSMSIVKPLAGTPGRRLGGAGDLLRWPSRSASALPAFECGDSCKHDGRAYAPPRTAGARATGRAAGPHTNPAPQMSSWPWGRAQSTTRRS